MSLSSSVPGSIVIITFPEKNKIAGSFKPPQSPLSGGDSYQAETALCQPIRVIAHWPHAEWVALSRGNKVA